ncbi:hypothetical protein AH04_287 [Erwinia phage AH04]|uniref:Glycolipid transfer protein domain-containing protein n=1 Tax=Erwinia phage AH04 TaxID=2869569 RepID=A0AAE7X0V3_9CAUD|nr:hypothetical protein PQC02_gp027 [Erwinia phage AH04]QZA70759.1 hypothetical protein AH04_287 [Erwinia phage AH04]
MAWVKRTFKRDWLQRSPSLNTVSYRHELSNTTVWTIKPEKADSEPSLLTQDDYYPHEQMFAIFELTFGIGSQIVKLHANNNIGVTDALKDYTRKLEQLRDLLGQFLSSYKDYYDMSKVFVLKEFLNTTTGPSAVYTSMIAIGTSVSHDFFFDIASCEDKARLYETKERDFVELIIKLNKFITSAITDAKTAMETYKGRL